MNELRDINELLAPHIARLRELGLTGDLRLWIHTDSEFGWGEWTLFSTVLFPEQYGNQSFATWAEVEAFVVKRLPIMDGVDLLALGM